MPAETIGERIRDRRRARGMTQLDLADAVGLTVESVSRAERGTIQPKVETLRKIAAALGTTLDAFAGDQSESTDEKRADPPELLRLRRQLARLDRRALRRILAIVELIPSTGERRRPRD